MIRKSVRANGCRRWAWDQGYGSSRRHGLCRRAPSLTGNLKHRRSAANSTMADMFNCGGCDRAKKNGRVKSGDRETFCGQIVRFNSSGLWWAGNWRTGPILKVIHGPWGPMKAQLCPFFKESKHRLRGFTELIHPSRILRLPLVAKGRASIARKY